MAERILEGIAVVDLANEYGAFCGKLLADMGACVIKVEPPNGDCTRRLGPFYKEEESVENSLFHAFYNAGKKSVVLNPAEPGDMDVLKMLLENADILLETVQPGQSKTYEYSCKGLRDSNPKMIICSITPFGKTGSYAEWKADSELIPFAMAGPMYETGETDRPPIQLGYQFLSNGASMYALAGILAALTARERHGCGDDIEVSLYDIAGAWRGLALGEVQQAPDYRVAERRGSQGLMIPSNFYSCKDGKIFMMASGRWRQVVEWMKEQGIDIGDKDDPKYLPDQGFNKYLWQEVDEVNRLIGELAAHYTMQEMMEEGQRRRVPVGAAETTKTVLNNPQYQYRNFFREITHPVFGTAKYPGPAFGYSDSIMEITACAPLLGEHTRQMVSMLKEKNISKERLALVGAEGGVDVGGQKQKEKNKNGVLEKPLTGIRVLDLGWVVAGPHGARLLGDLGAEVIRIESASRVDPMRIDTMRYGAKDCLQEGGWGFQENSRNKKGLALNLKSGKGKEIFYRLVERVDVVTCNFAPGGFHKMGIDYESLKKINPKIIVVNASGLGDNGPYGSYMTFAPVLACLTGVISVMGYEGEGAFGYPGLLADYVGGVSIAAAVTGALYFRQRTGRGQFIDLSQAEATIQGMGPALLDQQFNKKTAVPFGNHHYDHQMVPHNCYECKKRNTWCVIAVERDAEWKRLTEIFGQIQPTLLEERFLTQKGRKQYEAEIDRLIAKCCKQYDYKEVVRMLQHAGVSAGPVQNNYDFLYEDEHARMRKYFRMISFPDSELIPKELYLTGSLIRTQAPDDTTYKPGPVYGQDNDEILKSILQWSDDEIASAKDDGAFC